MVIEHNKDEDIVISKDYLEKQFSLYNRLVMKYFEGKYLTDENGKKIYIEVENQSESEESGDLKTINDTFNTN